MSADKDGSWQGSMGFAQFAAAGGEEDSSDEGEEESTIKQQLIGRGMGSAHYAGGAKVKNITYKEVKRGHISGFVRGNQRKESLKRQSRMDQLKDRFQSAPGIKAEQSDSDDADTYGPKRFENGKSNEVCSSSSETPKNGDRKVDASKTGKQIKCDDQSDENQRSERGELIKSISEKSNFGQESFKNMEEIVAKDKKSTLLVPEKAVDEPHIQWREAYDRVLPEELLSKCLPYECLVCNVKLPSGGARQHYMGSRHAKGVTRAVEHLPRGVRPRRLVDGPSITPTLTSSVVEEAKKAWSLKPKEYEPPVDEQEKERRARFRVSRGQIHHYNKDSRRLDFWI